MGGGRGAGLGGGGGEVTGTQLRGNWDLDQGGSERRKQSGLMSLSPLVGIY